MIWFVKGTNVKINKQAVARSVGLIAYVKDNEM